MTDGLDVAERSSATVPDPGVGDRYGEVVRADWLRHVERIRHPLDGSPVYTAPTPDDFQGRAPIVLLHGVGNDGGTFGPILPSLAESRPVVAPVLNPALLTDTDSPFDAVAGLVEFLAALAPPPWQIVGHSMGGVISGLLMRARPDTVAGAVLINSPLPGVTRRIREGDTFDRTGRALLAMKALAQITSLGRPRLPTFLRRVELTVVRNALRGFVADPGSLDDAVIAYAVIASRTRDADRFLRLARRLPDRELSPFDAAPVRILIGARDPLTPPDDVADIAAAYPAATIETIPSSGHFAHLETPHRVIAAIDTAFPPA